MFGKKEETSNSSPSHVQADPHVWDEDKEVQRMDAIERNRPLTGPETTGPNRGSTSWGHADGVNQGKFQTVEQQKGEQPWEDEVAGILLGLNPQELQGTLSQLNLDPEITGQLSRAYSSHHVAKQNPKIFKEMYGMFGNIPQDEVLRQRFSSILRQNKDMDNVPPQWSGSEGRNVELPLEEGQAGR